MSKRLAFLEKSIEAGSKDAFTWYALALEYANLGRLDDALKTFTSLKAIDASYVPMYLMCGQILAKAGRAGEARAWLTEGIVVARAKGDAHAQGEMESALAAETSSLGPRG